MLQFAKVGFQNTAPLTIPSPGDTSPIPNYLVDLLGSFITRLQPHLGHWIEINYPDSSLHFGLETNDKNLIPEPLTTACLVEDLSQCEVTLKEGTFEIKDGEQTPFNLTEPDRDEVEGWVSRIFAACTGATAAGEIAVTLFKNGDIFELEVTLSLEESSQFEELIRMLLLNNGKELLLLPENIGKAA